MGPARGRRPGAVLDAAADLPAVRHRGPRAGLDQAGAVLGRRLDGLGAVHALLLLRHRPAVHPARARHRRRPVRGLRRRVPGAHRRVHGRRRRGSSRGYDASRGRRGPPARRPCRAELLRRHVPAAVAVRAAGRPRGAGAVRPPALGRGDDRAVPAAVRARVHQLGPVRGRAGHPRHVGLGPPPAGARRGPPGRSVSRRSSIPRCCSSPSSCCACAPGGCGTWLRTAAAAGVVWLGASTCRSHCWRRRAGAASSGSTAAARPTRTRVWNLAAAP